MSKYPVRSMALRVLALAACGVALGGAASAAEVMLRYGIDDDRNINRLPQVVAEREGIFAREGLQVQVVPFTVSFRAPPGAKPITMREAMAKGEIDMSRQQLPLLVNDVMAGGKFVGVSVAVGNPVYFLVAPRVCIFADLKGKTITITNPRDGITVWTRKLLAQHGLKDDDVKLKNIAGSEGRLSCLKSGECAGASLAQPAILDALATGSHALGITNEIGPQLYQVDIVAPRWAAAHRALWSGIFAPPRRRCVSSRIPRIATRSSRSPRNS
jgi:NitT/TauT family transport system substrate-binding protein